MLPSAVDPLLAFAARSCRPGGFGYLNADGSTDPERPLEAWITARMTHVFSLALLLGRDVRTGLAAHGVDALLRGPLRDDLHDGWYSARPGTDDKGAYEHAFVVLAGASASQAGVPGASDLLDAALSAWDRLFWDDAAGAAVSSTSRDGTAVSPYRGANENMHGVEALLAAADARPDLADELRQQALRIVRRFVHDEAGTRSWRLPEHFHPDWQVDLEHSVDKPADPFRPYGVTVGHELEWARLAVSLSAALGDSAPSWLLADARALYAAGKDRGWAADGLPGFVYTLDWHDRPVVAARMHWVQAEAVSAAGVLLAATGDGAYRHDLEAWQAHASAVFLDPTSGNWHHELTPAGVPATGTWSGQPDAYHVLQAMLLPYLPVTGSVAESLRRSGPRGA